MKNVLRFIKMLLITFLPFFSEAQAYWEGTLSYGVMAYYGDMSDELVPTEDLNPGVQLGLQRFFDNKHAIRLNLAYGKITGDDRRTTGSGVSGNAFQANIFEASIIGQIDLIGEERFTRRVGFKKTFTPYFFTGAGVIFAEPDVTYSDPNNDDAVIDYPNVHLFMPVGGGLKYDLSTQMHIGFEIGIRFTASDYLDGVQNSGNAYRNDGYIFSSLTVGYRLVK